MEFVRVTMRTDGKPLCVWAIVIKRSSSKVVYQEISADGDRMVGRKNDTVHYLMGAPEDIMSEKPARMNGKYARMEVIK